MLLVLLGSPGSGKGTISEVLAKNNGFIHISTGNIFREIMTEANDLALEIKNKVDNGILIDDELTWKVVINSFKNIDFDNQNIILDGYPRNKQQFDFLEKYIISNKIKLKILFFDISKEEVMVRLSNRIYCPKCNRTYHKIYKKPIIEWICDNDQTKLLVRKDDQEDAIKQRLDIYFEQTMPLIKAVKNHKDFYVIDSKNETYVIYDQIKGIINV